VNPAAPAAQVRPAVPPAPAIPGVTTVPLPELLDERNKRQALEKTVEDLKLQMGALQKVAPAPAVPLQPTNQFQEQMDKLWESDPRRAVQAEIMTAINWFDGVQASVDAQEHVLQTKYNDYNNYRTEVRNYVRSLPIEQRMKEGIAELAYYAVKGQHLPTDQAAQRQLWEAEFLEKVRRGEVTSIPAGAISTPSIVPQTQATDEERKVADAMGMSVDEYLKYKRGV
jgi:hypothetical protein